MLKRIKKTKNHLGMSNPCSKIYIILKEFNYPRMALLTNL